MCSIRAIARIWCPCASARATTICRIQPATGMLCQSPCLVRPASGPHCVLPGPTLQLFLIHLGLANTALATCSASLPDSDRQHVLTVLPLKSARQCNALAFNAAAPHLLACGLDKYRADPSVLIWDLSRACVCLVLAVRCRSMASTQNPTAPLQIASVNGSLSCGSRARSFPWDAGSRTVRGQRHPTVHVQRRHLGTRRPSL